MTHRNLSCTELDERLGDYLERTLADAAVADVELHLAGCASCRALVRDFERITREAATLVAPAPARDLWPSIAARLDAPAIDLAAHRSRRAAALPSSRWQHLRTGAIAAGLVGITAISTYYLTSRSSNSLPSPVTVAATDSSQATSAQPSAGSGSQVSTVVDTPRLEAGAPAASLASETATPVSRDTRRPARATFDAEISSLRGALQERREELDPRTVAVLEASIATIDSAIAEARRALEVDPASRFLSTQLNRALEKKLGLLRTAALLPART